MTTQMIQMKISLDDIRPEIWRRFLVDSSISLDKFHDIIQEIMGWTNSHLYGFIIDGVDYSLPDDEFESDSEDTRGTTLKELGLRPKQEIKYTYDYGDDWEHTITVEKISEDDMKMKSAYCIEGARNCPPEDCGSIPGYEDIVEAMKKPNSKQAKGYIEWLGGSYDPEKLEIDEINDALKYFT